MAPQLAPTRLHYMLDSSFKAYTGGGHGAPMTPHLTHFVRRLATLVGALPKAASTLHSYMLRPRCLPKALNRLHANSLQAYSHPTGILRRSVLAWGSKLLRRYYKFHVAISARIKPQWGLGEPTMAPKAQPKQVHVLSVSEDGAITIPAGTEFTIHPARGLSQGGIIVDKGLSNPDPETGEQFKLGSKFWRASGTIQLGELLQEVAIHIPMFTSEGKAIRRPNAGQMIRLPEGTKYWKSSGSRWELYAGKEHPMEKYNIDPASYSPRYNPPTVQAQAPMAEADIQWS